MLDRLIGTARRAALASLLSLTLATGLAMVAPALPAGAATCAAASKSVGGAFTGEDGRRLSAQVGITIFDAGGNPINRFGCPKQPGDDGPSGYTFLTLVNGVGTCCFQLDANGADPNDTRYANTWRIDGLPANAAFVWAEAYPKSAPQQITDYSRYGGAMRRLVPVNLSTDIRLPLGCGAGGDNGSITGRAFRNGNPVAVNAVFAFSRADEGTGTILGFVAIGQGGTSDGKFTVPQLEPRQSYALSFQLSDGTQYWFENDYGSGLPVNPCAATTQNFAMQPDGHATIVEPASSGPGAVFGGGSDRIAYRFADGSVHLRSGSGITALGGQILGAPDTALSGGRVAVVARGTTNTVWLRMFDGANWGGWTDLGGVVNDPPTVVSWGGNRFDVFATGTDKQLWHRWTNDSVTWSGWEPLGGILTAGPDASSWGGNRLDIVGRGTDGQVWHRFYDGGWSGWEPLGGQLVGGPASASPAGNRYDVVVRGTDDGLYVRTWNGAQWLPWAALGGKTANDPDAFGSGGVMTAYVTGTDGSIYTNLRLGTGQPFLGWRPI